MVESERSEGFPWELPVQFRAMAGNPFQLPKPRLRLEEAKDSNQLPKWKNRSRVPDRRRISYFAAGARGCDGSRAPAPEGDGEGGCRMARLGSEREAGNQLPAEIVPPPPDKRASRAASPARRYLESSDCPAMGWKLNL